MFLPGLLFLGGGRGYHLPTSCEEYTQIWVWDLCCHLLGCLLVWHRRWQGSLTVFGWEWGHGPSPKCPRPQVEQERDGLYRESVHPSTLLPTAKRVIGKLQKLKVMRFLLALYLWECFYLSTKWLSFNEFLIICTSTNSIFISLLCQ